MEDSRFLDAARKARDAAAARAGELSRSASPAVDAIRELATDARNQLADAAADVQQLSLAKLEEAVAEFNAALPLLREAGYVLSGVRIKLGLVPQVQAEFDAGAAVSDERVEEMLAEHAERRLTALLLRGLRQATKLQEKLSFRGLRPDGLTVDVGLIPDITVRFSPVALHAPPGEGDRPGAA